MKKKRHVFWCDAREMRILLNALVEYRNYLLSQGRYTDAVDELLIKLYK